MLIVFRADASLQIGSGHVVRCLTLAKALKARGATCHFVCRAHVGHLIDYIRQKGIIVHPLPANQSILGMAASDTVEQPVHATWLGATQKHDAYETAKILGTLRPDWLIVDHYALDDQWEQALRPYCDKIMVIDDLADRPHDCDLLLDQNLGRTDKNYVTLVPDHCARLTGPRYSLLRPEFTSLREYSLSRRKQPQLKSLLITMGGVDQPNATSRVLQALKGSELPLDVTIIVVMGAQAPWLQYVQQLAVTMPWRTEVRVNVSDMAQLMATADLAIGAAGTTSWERCCLGLPTLLVVLAKNQWAGALALQSAGAVRLLGEPNSIQEQLAPAILSFLNEMTLAQISISAQSVTDGQGVTHVIQRMESEL